MAGGASKKDWGLADGCEAGADEIGEAPVAVVALELGKKLISLLVVAGLATGAPNGDADSLVDLEKNEVVAVGWGVAKAEKKSDPPEPELGPEDLGVVVGAEVEEGNTKVGECSRPGVSIGAGALEKKLPLDGAEEGAGNNGAVDENFEVELEEVEEGGGIAEEDGGADGLMKSEEGAVGKRGLGGRACVGAGEGLACSDLELTPKGDSRGFLAETPKGESASLPKGESEGFAATDEEEKDVVVVLMAVID